MFFIQQSLVRRSFQLFQPTRAYTIRYFGRVLRPYQQECIDSCMRAFQAGKKRVGISLATGSGKTALFPHLIQNTPELRANANQCLILVHRRELAQQAYAICLENFRKESVEIDMGTQHATGNAPITVASPMSLKGDRLEKYNPENFKLIIVDEVHHLAAPTYLRVLKHFGADETNSKVYLIGLTATFYRADGKSLSPGVDEIVYHRHFVDMIGENWLVQPKVIGVEWSPNLNLAESTDREDREKFEREVQSKTAIFQIPQAWIEHAKNRSSTLVFCTTIEHSLKVCNAFRKLGIDARVLSGRTNPDERKLLVQEFREKRFPVLVNCMVLTEGADIPNIDCLIIARPTNSPNLLTQMIGRGLRLSPGKEDCLIIDFCDSFHRVPLHMQPTLSGIIEFETSPYSRETKETNSEDINYDPGTVGLHSTLHYRKVRQLSELLKDMEKNDNNIYAISPNAWVPLKLNRYALSTKSGTLIVDTDIESGKFNIIAYEKQIIGQHTYNRKKVVGTNISNIMMAIRGADSYVEKYKLPSAFILRNASWRKKPAYDSQKEILRNKKVPFDEETLKAGTAADMITRLIHGKKTMKRKDQLQNYLSNPGQIGRLKEFKAYVRKS
ncbi:ATP-dependent DNA helicase Irc3 [Schizosaccharomyces cryophilus OY26]|uniref:ATP-dependent DNA helicase Irc3 n=1 Tax=Schizosaccharomyces cryophilus (strain OY26 / ATCC MYA-4695 / CBS 11777 / NBRC 106824 / NRRL Y48691) TaxID=653667 RepID=S9X0G5_SCHCR|nr:ATP-dependent DNA helicase Irc3 [Schizosaccharomyces cryophilus OY26]EPY50447.1 ATP-dependent DNA helicase Irc3 [Schizosaccharomyces cryophilus OY26]